jgi:CO/xanthine dehydrogenase Mo-binding subunit
VTATPAVPVIRDGVGARVRRTDGRAKVRGAFAYASDLHADAMLIGVTLRSPHASARIRGIDTAAARAVPGVRAVLTHEDVPGAKCVGTGPDKDQPVLAFDRVRHHGEPVAVVAAEDLAAARRAAALIAVDYEPLVPLTSAETALAPGAEPLHPGGNDLRTLRIVHGEPDAPLPADAVVVEGVYEIGMQDQAFLGPEAGLARPLGDGGVELEVATQWLHMDREQIAAALGLPEDGVRLVLAGVGGAFGGREDLSVHVHACLLALATGRPVKMSYAREESFAGGHVHRHPARLEYEHAAAPDGRLLRIRARLLFDGGAYQSSSTAVISNAATLACGPYAVPHARIEGTVAYTNNPPCGAMRGFGAPQVTIAYEAQMDRLAAALGLDPLELRLRNALQTGGEMPTGQRLPGPADAAALLGALRDLPAPDTPDGADRDPRGWPAGAFGGGEGEGVRRGVGYAYGFKNIAFSEGFDDAAVARVRLSAVDGEAVAEVHCAATEVGQGFTGVCEQIARTELGVETVRVRTADTAVGSSGSASASRLTWIAGGAVQAACAELRTSLGLTCAASPEELAALVAEEPVEREATYRHPPTSPLDERGRGDVHAGFAFVAHRAIVEVDVELGMARVRQLACAQDVGRAVNPLALEGQLEGGSVQGLGLALMEELVVEDGVVVNGSFGGYRIPTIVDAPQLPSVILELEHPDAPYGVTGVGELASITSTAAVLAALRDATGLALTRAPVRPEDLVRMEGLQP